MGDAVASGEVRVGSDAQLIARTILDPPVTWYRRPLWAIVRNMTVGQLPAKLRRQYGLRWGWPQRLLFSAVRRWARLMRFLLPRYLGRSRAAAFAQRRVRGELAPPASTPLGGGSPSVPPGAAAGGA
jgi:uncharacterized protein (DUF2236 family)